MGIIKLNNIRVYAFHGCMEEEARIGSEYIVNVVLGTDFLAAASQDELKGTIDYVAVNRIVQEEMAIRSKLIESVGLRIATKLKLEFDTLDSGSVEIIKMNPPMGGQVDSVSVTIAL